MTKKSKDIVTWLVIGLAVILLCPFPTQIAQPIKLQFVRSDRRAVEGLRVSQYWESYGGLFGSGRDVAVTDASGHASFPARAASGNLVTRIGGRLMALLAVHSSSGARVTIEFTLPPPLQVRFRPPEFSQLEPFATSGSYLDLDARIYFPQISADGQRVMVSGGFAIGKDTLRIPIEKNEPNQPPEPTRG